MTVTIKIDQDRVERLNRFVDELTSVVGNQKRKVVDAYREDLENVTPHELLALRLFSDSEFLSANAVLEDAGKWTNVFHKGLSKYPKPSITPDAIQSEEAEAIKIRKFLDAMKPLFSAVSFEDVGAEFIIKLNEMESAERRMTRYEYVMFPMLGDRLPSDKPLNVLWALHDRIRRTRKELLDHLINRPNEQMTIRELIGMYYLDWIGLLDKHERILLPVAVDLLNPGDWDAMEASLNEIGYAFEAKPKPTAITTDRSTGGNRYETPNGSLSFEDLDLLFQSMPIDITYVDEHDKVRYFNETGRRFFPRTAEVIGRSVERCHPEHSIRYVKEIIAKFRSGEASKATFWIRFKGRLLLITYLAVRDKSGTYRGVLESTQDITDIQSLEGERRLADWDR